MERDKFKRASHGFNLKRPGSEMTLNLPPIYRPPLVHTTVTHQQAEYIHTEAFFVRRISLLIARSRAPSSKMAANSSSGSVQQAHQQAHAAFPAMPPPPLNADQVPNTPRALRALIESTPDPRSIIPVLQAVAAGTNQQGSKKAVQMRNGETVLQSSGWDLYSIEDSDIATYTAALVYIL